MLNGDNTTTVLELREKVAEFVSERKWEKFHTPKNLAESICIEAAELLEIFQWIESEESRGYAQLEKNKDRVCEELADIMIYSLSVANSINIDLSESVIRKIKQNTEKYPKDKFHGKAREYS